MTRQPQYYNIENEKLALSLYLNKFENYMAYSEEGERSQDIMEFEQRNQSQDKENMMGRYI